MFESIITNKRIKFGTHSISVTDCALLILFFAEFLFVVYCNLCRIPITLDNDAAKVFTHAIEMWNSKKIFIPNWVNETMLELDTALLFAVPLFGLTKDIFFSFGMSNIIILLLFYAFLFSILDRMKQPLSVKVLSCLLITIPYSFGQLLYFDMMFFSGGFYGIKILLPLMLIWILTTDSSKRNLPYYMVLVVSFLFSFLFSISTGPYSLMCALVPVTACYIWLELGKMESLSNIFSKWLLSFNNLILYIEIFCALSGIVVGEKMNVESSGSSMSILEYGDFMDNALWLVDSFLELFGATPYSETQIMSYEGITSLSHYAFALMFLVCLIAICFKYFKSLATLGHITYDSQPAHYLFVMFIINLMVISLCTVFSNCRYQLMCLLPAMPLCVIIVYDLVKKISSIAQRQLTYITLMILIIVVMLTSNIRIMRDDCRPDMTTNIQKYEHVLDILNNYPERFIFLLDDEGMAETLRAYDYNSGREYLAYMTGEHRVSVHDYYSSRTDASYFDSNNLLIIDEYITSLDALPEYISNTYAEIDGYQNIHIYRSSVNRMDGVVGFEANNTSVDYFYSTGYEVINGEFSSDGGLQILGNNDDAPDVISPWMICNTPNLAITLEYTVKDSVSDCAGIIQVENKDSGEIIAEGDIFASKNSITLSDISTTGVANITVQIKANPDSQISLSRIVYTK